MKKKVGGGGGGGERKEGGKEEKKKTDHSRIRTRDHCFQTSVCNVEVDL